MEAIEFRPIGRVVGGRHEIIDDRWGDVVAEIVLEPWLPDGALEGLNAFSHLEVVTFLDRASEPTGDQGRRRPRGLADLPEIGILAQRHKDRPGRLGLSRCSVVSVAERSIEVKGLDAVDGTPVVDLKPWFDAFGPLGAVREPAWVSRVVEDYWS